MIIFNGQQLDNVEYNGVNLDKVIFNGVIVYEKTEESGTTVFILYNDSKSEKTVNLRIRVEEAPVIINGYSPNDPNYTFNYTATTTGSKSYAFNMPSYGDYRIELTGGKIKGYSDSSDLFSEGNIFTAATISSNVTNTNQWLHSADVEELTINSPININIDTAEYLETLNLQKATSIEAIKYTAITQLTIPASVQSISSYSLASNFELEEVHILGSNTVLSDNMFYQCYGLQDVYIYSTVPAATQGPWFYSSYPTIHLSSTLTIDQAKELFGSTFNQFREGKDTITLDTVFDL